MTKRERILAVGGPGSGKTYNWMRLAKYFKEAHFFVIDSEIGAEGSLEEFPEIENVEVHEVINWKDYRKAQKDIKERAEKGDWIVIDMIDKAWKTVQKYYVSEIFDQEMGEYFLAARKKVKKDAKSLFTGADAALGGWKDWPVINRLYEDFMNYMIYESPAHLYMASKAEPVSKDDPKLIRELFGPCGVKPAGQKDLAYQPDSVLLFRRDNKGYYMETIKDRRGRKYQEDLKLINFPLQYGKVAGWL
jgi:hypothetical protein